MRLSKHLSFKNAKIANVVTFVILWHFFFASSFVLRLNPQIFWPLVFIVAVLVSFYNKAKIWGRELEVLITSLIGLVLCVFTPESWDSVINGLYFIIYLCVAAMISRYTSGEIIRTQILFFCIIHLICIYLQVFFTDIYISFILPLLPPYAHSDIIEQMTYNYSYYGFTVQTSISAMYMTFGAIIAAVNVKYKSTRVKKIVSMLLVLLFITGILFVTRRGSLLATLMILVYIYFDTSRSKFSRLLLLIMGIAVLAYLGIDNIPGMQGMLAKFDRLSSNVMNGRQNIWEMALENLWNYPLFGYGIGRANSIGDVSIDNAYIAVLVERGIIGAVIYFIPYLHIFLQSYIKRKNIGLASLKTVEVSFFFQMLFIIMSVMENYYGQALSMFIFYLMIFSEQFESIKEKTET